MQCVRLCTCLTECVWGSYSLWVVCQIQSECKDAVIALPEIAVKFEKKTDLRKKKKAASEGLRKGRRGALWPERWRRRAEITRHTKLNRVESCHELAISQQHPATHAATFRQTVLLCHYSWNWLRRVESPLLVSFSELNLIELILEGDGIFRYTARVHIVTAIMSAHAGGCWCPLLPPQP